MSNFVAKQALLTPLKTDTLLLTGATGVLGGYLLKLILEETHLKPICLIRADNVEQAKIRIQKILKAYEAPESLIDYATSKVEIVLGEITKPDLGLTEFEYKALTEKVDWVIHCAGKVSLHAYEWVATTNVDGTRHMIDFTLQTSQKYFLYVSSYSVMGDRALQDCEPFYEENFNLGQGFQGMGYQQTKFEAEALVRNATKQGLCWKIVRPGDILGESCNGCYPLLTPKLVGIFYDILKTVLDTQLGFDSQYYFNITPVNYVAQSILYLGTQHSDLYVTYHLTNPVPRSYGETFQIIQDLGYPVKIVSVEEYMNRLHTNKIMREEQAYSSKFLKLVRMDSVFAIRGKASTVNSDWTASILSLAGINCPNIDNNLLKTYLEYCKKVNYFNYNPKIVIV